MEGVAVFEVLEPGVLTTVQDLGRYGFRQFGVPPSGALDSFSLRVANLLVGNAEEEACLETTLMGLKLKALREAVIAITGGDLSSTLNGDPLEMWRTHLLVEGDLVAFRKIERGCRAYLSVAGGFAIPRIMGSRSTFLSGKFGGFEGRPIKRGDLLWATDRPTSLSRVGLRFPEEAIPPLSREVVLHIIPGPQHHHFTEKGLRTLCASDYQVTRQCDRMGIRLEGPRVERRSDVGDSILSEGLISGAIQVPGDGMPILILTELVSGGYSKIATVISADLSKAGQIKPGDTVRFEPARLEEAHDLLRNQQEWIEGFKRARGGT